MAKSKTTKASSKKTTKSSPKPAKKPAPAPAPKAKTTRPAAPAKSSAAKSASKPVATKVAPAKTAPAAKAVAKPAPVAAKPTRPAARVEPAVSTRNRAPAPKPVLTLQQQAAQAPRQMMSTSDKPKKNQAGLGARDLEHFRELLLAKRRELLGDMSSMEREALRSTSGSNLSNLPVHMADMGTDNYEQEFTLGLVEKDRVLLREINHALAKIQDGTYGICEGTGLPIGKPRLEAKPWARHSIDYARKIEMGLVRQ